MSFVDLPDLAARVLGGGVVDANDELFAARDNLLNPEPSTFDTWTYGPKGKVYDGWETRRRRTPGHDYAIVRLGAPGAVHGVVIDTAHFTGNYPPFASVEGCGLPGVPSVAELAAADWFPLVPRQPLAGDIRNLFVVSDRTRVTHVRLSIYPDGGVARLRVHGEVIADPLMLAGLTVDLAAMEYGGLVVEASDRFYGSPNNLILPGHARTMGEGWETARRRDDGNDWVVVRLAAPGVVSLVELDSIHYKGNAPGAAAVHAIDARTADRRDAAAWVPLLPRTDLQPDTRHRFRVPPGPTATHVRLDIYPDGGMGRMRLLGTPVLDDLALTWFNALPAGHAAAVHAELAGRRPLAAATELSSLWRT